MLKQIITKIEVVIAEAEYKVKNQTMGPKNTIFLALVVTLIAKESFAAQHVVGGSKAGINPQTLSHGLQAKHPRLEINLVCFFT